MTSRNTWIFGSALLVATAAVVVDHRAHTRDDPPPATAPKPAPHPSVSAQDDDEGYTPCGAV